MKQTRPLPIDVSVERTIEAPAGVLYDLVSDVTRMGEWSPETVRCEWLDDADGPVVGARFEGTNELGPNTWSTKPTVIEAVPGRVFAFEVPGRSGPIWRYEFEPTAGGTRVTESVRQQRRSPLIIRLLQRRAGVTDRQANLRQNMTTTLERLDQVARAASPTASTHTVSTQAR